MTFLLQNGECCVIYREPSYGVLQFFLVEVQSIIPTPSLPADCSMFKNLPLIKLMDGLSSGLNTGISNNTFIPKYPTFIFIPNIIFMIYSIYPNFPLANQSIYFCTNFASRRFIFMLFLGFPPFQIFG